MIPFQKIMDFYRDHLPAPPDAQDDGRLMTVPCPFCASKKRNKTAKILIDHDPESYFRGYFRCSDNCVPGGFHLHFGRLLHIDAAKVPGFDPDAEAHATETPYPPRNMGSEINKFKNLLGTDQREYFTRFGIAPWVTEQMQVGFNGRYLVYPYIQDNGFAYAARCVMPDRHEDHFWHGNEDFFEGSARIFNAGEIERCQGGALFITEGELNLLILKSMGYPAISVPEARDFVHIAPGRLAAIDNIFLLVANTPEARKAAHEMATQLGFKARILTWPGTFQRGGHLHHLAEISGKECNRQVAAMIAASQAFSPFSSPRKEHSRLLERLEKDSGKTMLGLGTGFTKLDTALDGLRGINILGGPPKVGKSAFFMQISTQIAYRKKPVIYYDFENGRQKIYLRTLVRTCTLPEKKIRSGNLDANESAQLNTALETFQELLSYFRVVTDRQLSPDVMRRHIDFLKHETQREDLLIVLDSLHKLPFKSLTERRTGIDFWLRQIEAIRDEQQVSFLVISELSRHASDGYAKKPDMSSFKESGDIEYSADNAMILTPNGDPLEWASDRERKNTLWLVASRENSPGKIAEYQVEYPYWRFREL